jgi:hypothetical protein
MSSLKKFCNALFFVIILILSMISIVPNLEAKDIYYKGLTNCEGRQLEISFVYDSTSSTIKNLKISHSCAPGINDKTGGVTLTIDKPIKLEDNKFIIPSIIEGSIATEGSASGKILEQIRTKCSDGKFYNNCVDWVADPQK